MFDVSMILKPSGFSLRFPHKGDLYFIRLPLLALMSSCVALPSAWVVKCVDCQCVVNCFAIDPQEDHITGDEARPRESAVVVW
jgi:hypothetical protein